MATMNISLPDPMKQWVEAQADTGRYSNASDYVRDLIRRDQERADKVAAMQRLVDEARAGGLSDETMADIRTRAIPMPRVCARRSRRLFACIPTRPIW
jgi:antitoxin ParD1/3/4